MPLIYMKKLLTPLELFGLSIYRGEGGIGYSKRRKKPRKKLFDSK